jgi:hypothetical protein
MEISVYNFQTTTVNLKFIAYRVIILKPIDKINLCKCLSIKEFLKHGATVGVCKRIESSLPKKPRK